MGRLKVGSRDAGLLGEWLKEEETKSGRPVHEL